jgi:3-hydroxybutyryl-CoA dehydrogenase
VIKKVAVVGMGTIGKSIALQVAQTNHEVMIVTRHGQEGFDSLRRFVEKETQKHKTQKSQDEILAKMSCVNTLSELPSDTQLFIEAITEELTQKQRLLQQLERLSKGAIFCSNTSSLRIVDISKLMQTPERMIGFHFFNPAHTIKLVEIIPSQKTSQETIEKAKAFAEELGKTSLIAQDQPGFIVNRVLFSMINEAIGMLQDGLSAEDIDAGMRLGANHPMGPLHLADFIGLDITLQVFENLYGQTSRCEYKPQPLLIQKVKEHNLGRKTGRGFFEYKGINI